MSGTTPTARDLLQVQANFTGHYNRNAARRILAGVQREHGQAAVDQLIRELRLDDKFGFEPGRPVEES